MSDIKTAVVFDTNSYRNVVHNKSTEETLKAITELIELENKKGIQAYGIQVSFLISDSTLDNKDVILVTNDGDLTEMMRGFGYSNKIFSLPEFHVARGRLELPTS